jgi:hypothetical protein
MCKGRWRCVATNILQIQMVCRRGRLLLGCCLLSSSFVYLAAPCFKLAQNNELPTYINNKEDNKPAKYADFLLNAPANGSAFFRFLIVRKNLICSSDATKLGERVEFYCNGKELRSAPRQKLRTCIGAACSMHCAFIRHKFLARNLLASLLLSAGRRRRDFGPKKTRGAMHFVQHPRSTAGSPLRRAYWRPQGRNSGPQWGRFV